MSIFEVMTLIAALGSGLVAGFFFAFSICVMHALAKIPIAQGVAAMQSINVAVINPWFLGAFFGTAAVCLVTVATALLRWPDPRAIYWLMGGALYLIGTIWVTMVFNVPRNNHLAALSPTSAEAAAYWADYLSTWTRWNHVRTIAPLCAALLFTLAYRIKT
jgi:uncharacterized membrane protein